MSNTDQLLLIDLSGIAHQLYHVSGNEPDPSFISNQIIARVRALATAHPYAALCCDAGRSFRADLDPTYKAQRDTENRAVIKHQIDVACDTLKRDGFPIWRVPGFEADDVIASAVAEAAKIPDTSVLIVTEDKDLLQLVNERVSVKNLRTGNVLGPSDVFDKFGVRPEQMPDLLALMGDASDNIKGAEKIGKVIGARLLSEHGSLNNLYEAMTRGVVAGVTPAMRTNLMEFKARWPDVAKLIALRTDVPIPFAEIAAERVAAPMVEESDMETGPTYIPIIEAIAADAASEGARVLGRELEPNEVAAWTRAAMAKADGRELLPSEAASALGAATAKAMERIQQAEKQGQVPTPMDRQAALIATEPLPSPAVPLDFSQQLEPRTMPEAVQLAQRMFESRLFSAYGTPQAVLATVLAGRELGIPAMASLRAFHIIEGKPQLSAGTIQSLVLKSGKALYFRCSERTESRATFVTKRGDDPEMALSYTIEEAKAAWQKTAEAWTKSTWGRSPADMLVARASSKLARLVYPDVVSGLYAPEEMD